MQNDIFNLLINITNYKSGHTKINWHAPFQRNLSNEPKNLN